MNSEYYYSRNVNKVPAHAKPLPVNPALHAHTKDPGVLLHVALPSQLFRSSEHSSTSVYK